MMQPPTVYVVDDEAAIRSSLRALLQVWGFSATTFGSAEEFWEAYSDAWTGLLLVDLRLPGKSGLELLEELQCRNTHLTAILMTGHGEQEVLHLLEERGAIGALSKPFHFHELKRFVDGYLQRE